MVEKFLITQADLLTFMPMSDLPDGRIDPFILKSQDLDLKTVLNDALYYDFLTKFDNSGDTMYAAYQNLLNGTTYTYAGQTIEYRGIKPMLASYVLARFIPMNQINISRYGIVSKVNAQSEPIDQTRITYIVNNLRSDAIAYQNQLVQFLTQNNTTYPLYNVYPDSNKNNTGMNFFSSSSRTSRPFGWWNGNYYPTGG